MSVDKQIAQLETGIKAEMQIHEELLKLLKAKNEAIREGDVKRMARICGRENEKVQRLSEVVKQRLHLVADLTQQVEPNAERPMRLGELVERLDEPARGRLLVLRQQLRQRMEEVGRQTKLAKRTSVSMLKHMHGIVQSVGSKLTGIATYTARGLRPQQVTAVRTLNMTA